MTDCEVFETYPDTILSAQITDPKSGRTTLLVSPRGDDRLYAGAVHHTLTFELAVRRIEPGVTLKLMPGKYYRAVSLSGKRGSAEKPIIIEGTKDESGNMKTHICGTNAAGAIYPDLPDWSDYAFIKLRGCEHLQIKDLQVESCWPSFLYAERTHALHVENVHAQDGTYVVFLRGPAAHDISIRNCSWDQDPTRSLWNLIDWRQTHHGAYAYYNGALIGGIDVEGDVEISGNHVRNAFNGIRFTTSSKDEGDVLGKFNMNFRIFSNRFENIRDNAVEPEITFLNWHVFENDIKNTQAPFSIHDVFGGYLYVYSNRIWFDDRGGADYQDHRGGKIYKLRSAGPLPKRPFHIFNNSIYTRTYLIKKARARNFYHRNNAVQICSPDDHPHCLCRSGRRLLKKFPVGLDNEALPWDDTVVFDGNGTNKPFDDVLTDNGQEGNGVVDPNLGLTDPMEGDFRLQSSSPLLGAGVLFELQPEVDLPADSEPWSNWSGDGRPNIGAFQNDGPTKGPPFTPIS